MSFIFAEFCIVWRKENSSLHESAHKVLRIILSNWVRISGKRQNFWAFLFFLESILLVIWAQQVQPSTIIMKATVSAADISKTKQHQNILDG